MQSIEVLKQTLTTSMMVLNSYIGDLSDQEILSRPGKGCNHIAWQLGHLISSQNSLIKMLKPDAGISLPEGFDKQHSKANAESDLAANFCSKATYVDLFEKVNESIVSAFETFGDADLDQPGPENFRSMFPTVGSVCVLIATHPLMHAGQFVPVRRQLNKPIVI